MNSRSYALCFVLTAVLLSLPACERTVDAAEFVVNSELDLPDAQPGDGVSDAGAGVSTLRSALEEANALPWADTIVFDIDPGGPATIAVVEPLPTITDPVTIDGTTQPGFERAPIIELTGLALAPGPADGLTIVAGQSVVRGLVVNSFPGSAVVLRGGGGNRVAGCYLGTDLTGRLPLSNVTGVLIDGSPDNLIGGTDPADRNVISANESVGVFIWKNASTGNNVQGNYIGADVTGTLSLSNRNGVAILFASGNTIGGAEAGARNLISGNGNRGISLFGVGETRIEGNFIGTDLEGQLPLGNFIGVALENTSDNVIGGVEPGARNVISGNSQANVAMSSSRRNVVQGNYIGTDVDGLTPLMVLDPPADIRINGQPVLEQSAPLTVGVDVRFSDENLIGGTEPGAGNIISGNGETEVAIWNGRANVVQGNFIGPDATGAAAVRPRAVNIGVEVLNAPDTLVGGLEPGAGNVISGNAWGVFLSADVPGARVQGNLIGTNAAGRDPLSNTTGIILSKFGDVLIGGTTAAARNVISGNETDGVYVESREVPTIHGNFIGTDITGAQPLGNGGHGILLDFSVFDGEIGGAAPGAGNVIAHNGGAGVSVGVASPRFGQSNSTRRVPILSNSIFANAGLGIDLEEDGVTPNDAGDTDGGANLRQNFPVLTSARLAGGNVTVHGTLHSAPNTTFLAQFFANSEADPTGFGEGEQFLGAHVVTTDASGDAAFKVKFKTSKLTPPLITATATDSAGNTSEFSPIVIATVNP